MKQLQGLLAFVEVASAGSLTAAAQRLDVTPAAVSKSLARLEAQLGVRLVQRSTRRLALTAEGEAFLAKARAGLQLLDEAAAELAQAAASRRRDVPTVDSLLDAVGLADRAGGVHNP